MHHAHRHARGVRCGNVLPLSFASGRPSSPRSPQSFHETCDSHVPLQVKRRNKNGGRVNVGNKFIQLGAQASSPHLSTLVHVPIEHVLTCGWPERPVCCSAPLTGFSRHLLRVPRGSLALPTRGRSGAHFGVREAICGGRSEGARWPRALDRADRLLWRKMYVLVCRVSVR